MNFLFIKRSLAALQIQLCSFLTTNDPTCMQCNIAVNKVILRPSVKINMQKLDSPFRWQIHVLRIYSMRLWCLHWSARAWERLTERSYEDLMWPLEVFSSTFLMKGSMHLSPPMKRYVATFASQGSNLKEGRKKNEPHIHLFPLHSLCSCTCLINNLISTHARVRKGMYIRRGMQIICCSAKMAVMDCCTV